MKKYLVMALIVVVPLQLGAKFVAQTSIEIEHQNFINKLTNDKTNRCYNAAGNLDWTNVNNQVNKYVDSGSLLGVLVNNHNNSVELTEAEKIGIKAIAKGLTTKFQYQQATLQQATDYLKANNHAFKTNYSDHSKIYQNVIDKAVGEYFGSQKLDLNLNGHNTNQEALNAAMKSLKAEYGQQVNDLKVTLVDSKIANKTLFDDSNLTTITNFINNKLTIAVNVQAGSQKAEPKNLQLTNVKLNDQADTNFLHEAILSYFDSTNPQDFKLDAANSRADALNALIKVIKKRFQVQISDDASSKTGIVLLPENTGAFNENYLQNKSDTNDVFNNQMWFDVNIHDYNLKTTTTITKALYVKVKFNFKSMNQALNALFLTSDSIKHQQDLNLTTDNSFQDVIDKFNQRLANLCSEIKFSVSLQDPTLTKKHLDIEYDPSKSTNQFDANVKIGFIVNHQTYNLGNATIYLANVKLGAWAKKVKQAYDNLQDLTNKLTIADDTLSTLGAVLGVVAFGFLVASAFDPGLLNWAIGLTVAAAVVGAGAGALGVVMYNYEQNEEYWIRVATTTASIYYFAQTVYYIWSAITASSVAELNLSSLLAPGVNAAISVFWAIIGYLTVYL